MTDAVNRPHQRFHKALWAHPGLDRMRRIITTITLLFPFAILHSEHYPPC